MSDQRTVLDGRVTLAIPATIAGSDRSISEAGFSFPRDACTMDMESSTVTACRPLTPNGIAWTSE